LNRTYKRFFSLPPEFLLANAPIPGIIANEWQVRILKLLVKHVDSEGVLEDKKMTKLVSPIILAAAVLALPLFSSAAPVPFTQTPMYKYLCRAGQEKSPTYSRQVAPLQQDQPKPQPQEQPEELSKKDTETTLPPKLFKPISEEVLRPTFAQDLPRISLLTADTPFAEAIDILRNSVRPPLNIVVFWKDLEENADIDGDTSIGIEGLSGITLRKHLELILDSISTIGDSKVGYVVEDGIIKIATEDSLPELMTTRVYDISYLTAPPAQFFNYGGPYMFMQNRYGSGMDSGFGSRYGPGRDSGYGNYPSRYGNQYDTYRSSSYNYRPNISSGVGMAFR
jgi:hypothetical protein